MAHDVSFTVPERALGKADLEFFIKKDGKMLGTLKVSNGSLVWFPTGTTNGLKMSWSRFDKMMKTNATQIEAR